MRLDKWLWAARFYKTRRIAVDEIKKGRIQVSGVVAKPSKIVSIGDAIIINKASFRIVITVLTLNERRESAKIAETMYIESEESIARRNHESELRKLSQVISPERPDGRDKLKLRRLRQGFYVD